MEKQNSQFYREIVNILLKFLESEEITYNDSRRLYSSIIKVQIYDNLDDIGKIKQILKNCSECILQKLWFTIFKKSQQNDLINVFKNEILDRDFRYNLWCQEVFNHVIISSFEEIYSFNGESSSNLAGKTCFNQFFLLV